MPAKEFTIEDLRRIIAEAAGEPDAAEAGADITDVEFTELGYESIALLETAARIEREFGVRLDESRLVEAATPRQLVDLVNEHLSAVG